MYLKIVSAVAYEDRDKVQTILDWEDRRRAAAVVFAFKISGKKIATFWAKEFKLDRRPN